MGRGIGNATAARGGAALLTAALLLGGCGGGSDSTASTRSALSAASRTALDTAAQADARSAQVAIETFAAEQGGYYSDATPAKLRRISPGLPSGTTVTANGQSYSVTVPSKSGERYTVNRANHGIVSLTCAPAGKDGCGHDGTW